MDSSAWIGFGILLAVLLLLGYVRKASMGNSKKLGNLFNRITREKHLQISEKVTWDNGIIGIDPEKRAIAFVEESNKTLQHSILYLNSIDTCKVLHEREPNLTRIVLVLGYADPAMKPIEVCFFNSAVDIIGSPVEAKEKAKKIKDLIFNVMKKKV